MDEISDEIQENSIPVKQPASILQWLALFLILGVLLLLVLGEKLFIIINLLLEEF